MIRNGLSQRGLRDDAIPLTYRGWAALYRPELLHDRAQGTEPLVPGTVVRPAKVILKQHAPQYDDDPELTRTFGSSLAGLMTILHKPDGQIYAATLAPEDLAASAAVIDDPHATTASGNPDLGRALQWYRAGARRELLGQNWGQGDSSASHRAAPGKGGQKGRGGGKG